MNVVDLFTYVPKVILIAIVVILAIIVAEIFFLIIKGQKKKKAENEQNVGDTLVPVQFPGSTASKPRTQPAKMNVKKKTIFSPMLFLFGGVALIILIALVLLTVYFSRARLKIGAEGFYSSIENKVPYIASDYQIKVTLF